MKEKITNIEVSNFLKDYRKYSETEILEEGKQKDELLESARKRGIIIAKDDNDLGVIKTIYCFTSKANSNKARLPKDEFIKILPQIVGRPMNNCHEREFILGFYVDYKYILKEEKAITYAIFFKGAYPKLWKKAKDFQKKKKLSSSYEIWSNEEKRTYLEDGTYELHDMSIAGGALIFEEYGDEPAFKDAKVLSIASKQVQECIGGKCLVCASKYNKEGLIISETKFFVKKLKENDRVILKAGTFEIATELVGEKKWVKNGTCAFSEDEVGYVFNEKYKVARLGLDAYVFITKDNLKEIIMKPKAEEKELIISQENFDCECIKCGYKAQSKNHCNESKCPKCGEAMRRVGRPGTGRPDQSPNATSSTIKCSNCSEEFEYEGIENIKCPKCFAILNRKGMMQYPPQIKDFQILCPSCKVGDWLILSKKEDQAKLKCINCAKEYSVSFEKAKVNEAISRISFLYTTNTNCPQCGKSLYIAGRSGINERGIKCSKCGLEFVFNKADSKKYKKISKIQEIKSEKISEKGGIKMEKEKKGEAKVEETKVESKKVEKATEKKTEKENTKITVEKVEVAKVKDEKAETKSEKVVEDKKTPITENKEKVKVEEKPKELPKVKAEKVSVVEVEKTPKTVDDIKPEVSDKAKEKTATSKEEKITEDKIELATKRYKVGIRKFVKKIKELRKEKSSLEKKLDLYKNNAKLIIERREELGENCKLTDKEILNIDKFERAKMEKENLILKAKVDNKNTNEIVASKKKDNDYYAKKQEKVDKEAFQKVNEKNKK